MDSGEIGSSSNAPQRSESAASTASLPPNTSLGASDAASQTTSAIPANPKAATSPSGRTAVFKGLSPATGPADASTAGDAPDNRRAAITSGFQTTNPATESNHLAVNRERVSPDVDEPQSTDEDPANETQSSDRASKSKRRKKRSRSVARQRESRKVKSATLVEGGTIATRIQLGEDGTLPYLQVDEVESSSKEQTKESQSNPIMLVGILAASVLVSIAMLFVPSENQGPSQATYEESIEHIREHYFGTDPLRDYEKSLRRAIQYENRGDRRSAKRIYRGILNQLHREGLDQKLGLSGPRHAFSPPNDADLEEHLHILIRTGN